DTADRFAIPGFGAGSPPNSHEVQALVPVRPPRFKSSPRHSETPGGCRGFRISATARWIADMNDPKADALALARRQASHDARADFDREAANARHRLADSRAAVRLLLGAYAFREVGEDGYARPLQHLARAAPHP